ncbi:bud neck involved protein [Mortierella antarctica]|nr:bud neck involved protein [Mortierella antarctica]
MIFTLPSPSVTIFQKLAWLVIHAQTAVEETKQEKTPVMATPLPPLPATVTRLSSDQQSIHPLQVDEASTSSTSSSASLTVTEESSSDQQLLVSQAFSEPVVRKKTSFASKLRKVFIAKQATTTNSTASVASVKAPQQARRDSTESSSMIIDQQHRGSVSSASSTNSAERRGSTQSQSSITPSTSPEMSPVAVKSATSSTPSQPIFVASPTTPNASSTGSATTDNDVTPTLALPPTQTRTVKKRLSFASISSFFTPKNNQDEETRSKQQRSSSVPHVENPLVTVGRQIAGFQRRHSLNDLHEAKKKHQEQAKLASWNKDQDTVEDDTKTTENSGTDLAPTAAVVSSTAPTKSKLRLNNVFGKGRKNKKHLATGGIPKPDNLIPAKPLRPALVHRSPPQTNGKVHKVASRRRSSSVRSNQSNGSRHQRNSQAEEVASQSNASSGSSASGTTSLSRKSLEEHQAMINSLPPTAQQPQYTQHRERGTKHRRQGSQASRESDRHRNKPHHHYSASNSARDYQDLCSSPVSISVPENDAFASPVRPARTQPTRPGGAPLATAPNPRVLSGSLDVSKRSHNHVIRNPLSSLSPSSSCCSFTSDVDDEEDDETRGSLYESFNGRYSPSSPSSSVRSSGSSASRTLRQQLGAETVDDQNPYNPLLPAAAARISVDRIMMENAQAFRQDGSSSGSATLASDSSSTLTQVSKEDARIYAHQQQYSAHQEYQHHYLPEPQHLQTSGSPSSTSVSSSNHNLHRHAQEPQYYKHPSHYGEPDHPHHHQQYYHPHPSTYPPRPPRQLQFSTLEPLIHPTWTAEQYDRTSDTNITALRLTPAIAHKIKLELNQFKSQEMEVHQESRVYTHFFV